MPLCGYVRGRVDTHRSQTPWIPQEVGVKDNCKLPDIDTGLHSSSLEQHTAPDC